MSYCTASRKKEGFEQYWRKVPCIYENGYIDWTSWGDRSKVEPCLEWAIHQTHASVITVGKGDGCAKAYGLYKDLIEKFGRELGYRFEVKQAAFLTRPILGQAFQIGLEINNAGNAPVYFDCKLEISWINAAGKVLAQEAVDTVPPIRQWIPGQTKASATLKLPANLPVESMRLCIGVVNAATPEQRLALPLKNTADERCYVLGAITPQPTPPPPPSGKLEVKELLDWNSRLEKRVCAGVAAGQKPSALLTIMRGKQERVTIVGATEKTLTFDFAGNQMPLPWRQLDARDRFSLAGAFCKDTDGSDCLLLAAMALAAERPNVAADYLGKAEACTPKPDAAALAALRGVIRAK